MNRIALLMLLGWGSSGFAEAVDMRTAALRMEAKTNLTRNATKETHPMLYAMIKKLYDKVGIPMPRYITFENIETVFINEYGLKCSVYGDVGLWIDFSGDVCLNREVLMRLSYAEIEGILAVAIAKNAQYKKSILATTAVKTLAATVAITYFLGLCRRMLTNSKYQRTIENGVELGLFACLIFAMPIITTWMKSLSLEKEIYQDAAKITSLQQVIDGIKGVLKLKDIYVREHSVERAIKRFHNYVFYLIRSYTPEERIAYLEALVPDSQ